MKPLYSKSQDTRLAGAERRIRFLERREQIPNPHLLGEGGGDGIQFNTHPQDGGWLYVETTDATGSPNGWGIDLYAHDSMQIHTDTWNILMTSGHQIDIAAATKVVLAGNAGGVEISNQLFVDVSPQLFLHMDAMVGGFVLTIPSGTVGVFEIKNHLGTSLFKVLGDGTITP